MPTALVTGASGFLGGALARELTERDATVRVLVRPTSDLRRLGDAEVEVVTGDLGDEASLTRALEGIEVLYHCAGRVTDWAPWEDLHEANVAGVERLLRAAERTPSLRRVLHVSSTDVFGCPRAVPEAPEPDETTRIPYPRSKALGERVVREFMARTGIPTTLVRPASIYGPGSVTLVGDIVEALRGGDMVHIRGGQAPAGLLYIDHAVEAIVEAATRPAAVGKAYALRDEEPTTWRTYVEALAEGIGVPAPRLSLPEPVALGVGWAMEQAHRLLRRPGRPLLTRHAVLLLSRPQDFPIADTQADLGFRTRVPFEEGVRRSLEWVRATA